MSDRWVSQEELKDPIDECVDCHIKMHCINTYQFHRHDVLIKPLCKTCFDNRMASKKDIDSEKMSDNKLIWSNIDKHIFDQYRKQGQESYFFHQIFTGTVPMNEPIDLFPKHIDMVKKNGTYEPLIKRGYALGILY